MTLYMWPYIYRLRCVRRLETTPLELRVLKTSLRSVFKIHKDPYATSLTYTKNNMKMVFSGIFRFL